jgi:Effector-associated domain 1
MRGWMADNSSRAEFLSELARMFGTEAEARALLDDLDFPLNRIPAFESTTPLLFWREIVRYLEGGILPSGAGIEALAKAATNFTLPTACSGMHLRNLMAAGCRMQQT